MGSDAARAKEVAGLIERVEAATGPDRELDVLITAILFGWPEIDPTTLSGGKPSDRAFDNSRDPDWRFWCQPFSSSTDAALALVERMLPGCWRDCLDEASTSFRVLGSNADPRCDLQAMPLAICAALLRALSQESQDGQ